MHSDQHPRAPDLFEATPPMAELKPDLQARLRALVQALLAEAAEIAPDGNATAVAQEVCDDEDHR